MAVELLSAFEVREIHRESLAVLLLFRASPKAAGQRRAERLNAILKRPGLLWLGQDSPERLNRIFDGSIQFLTAPRRAQRIKITLDASTGLWTAQSKIERLRIARNA